MPVEVITVDLAPGTYPARPSTLQQLLAAVSNILPTGRVLYLAVGSPVPEGYEVVPGSETELTYQARKL